MIDYTRNEPTIAEHRAEIEGEIEWWTTLLKNLQAQCEHTFAKKVPYCVDAGYYDPAHYGFDWHCDDCGKKWSEPQK